MAKIGRTIYKLKFSVKKRELAAGIQNETQGDRHHSGILAAMHADLCAMYIHLYVWLHEKAIVYEN